jgi:uncharacterized membrane protein (UPF0127 family)
MTRRCSRTLSRLRPHFVGSALAVLSAVAVQLTRPIAVPAAIHAQAPSACAPAVTGATPPAAGAATDSRYVRISFTNDCGQAVPLYVDIAADDAREQEGLMGVNPLPEDEGELFVFANIAREMQTDQVHVSFWMKDTPIPLSVAFVGKDGTINEIQDMQAESLDLHTPALPYLYAVEANEGWFAGNAISSGDQANLAPALALLNGSVSP